MPRKSWTTLAAAAVALLALCAPAQAADGDLDTSFAGDGISHLERGRFAEVALQPDGKLIVAGQSFSAEGETLVGRLTASGSPDPAYGDGGFTVLGSGSALHLRDVAVQPDGRTLVIATRGNDGMGMVFRLTAGGALDPSFDGDGVAAFRFAEGYSWLGALALQPDGRIVVAGEHYDEGNKGTAAAARLDPDGRLDETFAGDGTTLLDAGDSEIAWYALIQGGRIVLAGMRGPPVFPYLEFWAARLEADGTQDPTFGTDGLFVTSTLLSEDGIVTPDGGLLFAGTGLNDGDARPAALLKLDADGHPDEGFAPGGRWTHDVGPGNYDRGRGVAVNHEGDYTLAVSSGNRLAAVKVTPQGTLVPDFGDGGERVYDSIGPFDAFDALRQPDGKFVVGGGDDEAMAVVRIHDTPPPAPPAPPDPPEVPNTPQPPLLELTAGPPAAEGQLSTFTATLSRPADQPVSFNFVTGEGSAATGLDFGGRRGSVTIPPGQTAAQIAIATNEDRLFETEELFRVELYDPRNARLGEYVAFATITNVLRRGRCQNVVRGRKGTDILTGSPAGDLIVGRQDIDFLFGLAGADCIRGERGGDIVDGGDGDDTVDGGSGDDRIKGGDGDDRLYGRRGRNRYNGGPGDDRIYARNGVAEIVECGPGRDTVKADSRDRLRRCEIVTR